MSQKQRYLPIFLYSKVKKQKQKVEKQEDTINTPDSQEKKMETKFKDRDLDMFTSEVTKMLI